MGRLVIVSNRLPVTVGMHRGAPVVSRSSGGLATGLSGPHRESSGLWIGWPGDTSHFSQEHRSEIDAQLALERLSPLHLSRAEVDGYYEGFSNRVLWPLFHYLVDHVPMERMQWDVYRKVNEKFADATAAQLRPGDTVWIHDYQLCLVPGMLRERVPGARIGFFLHIPFPAAEVLQALPWRDELLEGLLGADLIGFHTFRYQFHFADALKRVLGLRADARGVRRNGRSVRLGTYPMGIDAAGFDQDAQRPEVIAEAHRIRDEARGGRILLGIDRLDYTKGIGRRLFAFERLLQSNPALIGKVKLIQLAVPSRTHIAEYEELRQDVDEAVGRVNGEFSTTGWVPVHYLYRSFGQRELVALYRAADAMLITPLRDGMNLVAKEFVASRPDEQGVLLLSELAGAADELPDAVRVNPYDVDGLADAMLRAFRMDPQEQRARMQSMRTRVFGWDVHRWVAAFLGDLDESQPALAPHLRLAYTPGERIEALGRAVARAPTCALFLDLDGTLIPFAPTPDQANADDELRALLGGLASEPGVAVHIVTGRPRETLEAWFGELPLTLHAEHGLWTRLQPSAEWESNVSLDGTWKAEIRPLLEEWAWRTPGALVEEKSGGLAWHYRQADLEYGTLRATELKERLASMASRAGVDILDGDRVIEVRIRGVHKGMALRHARIHGVRPSLIMALGDDRTDEDLFRSLAPGSFAVHVGPKDSIASFRLATVADAREFLRRILEERGGQREAAGAAGLPH